MAQYARLFIGKQDILVLIDDVYPRLSDLEIGIFLARLFKKLIVYVKAQNVALVKARIALCAFAVKLYALYPYVLLQQRFRQQRHRLADKAVEPLTCVVSPYGQFLHTRYYTRRKHKKSSPRRFWGLDVISLLNYAFCIPLTVIQTMPVRYAAVKIPIPANIVLCSFQI